MAALICTEVLANNKDKSEDTYVATVDVQKAFDSVFHPSLLRKLFIATEADATWPLFSYLLHNIEVKVRIGPLTSRCVTLNQGVGKAGFHQQANISYTSTGSYRPLNLQDLDLT